MRNPLEAYSAIHKDFALYLRTAYGTKYDSLEQERAKLYSEPFEVNPGSFHRHPWIEPLPRYATIREARDPASEANNCEAAMRASPYTSQPRAFNAETLRGIVAFSLKITLGVEYSSPVAA